MKEGETVKNKSASFRLPELLIHRIAAQAKRENLTPDLLVQKIVETYLASEHAKGTDFRDIHAQRHNLPGITEKLEKAKREAGAKPDKKRRSTPSS